MAEREAGMQREKERIEQEEYEMKRYYEAEALKHEEMVRAHREVVKRFEEEVRRFERRRKDHEVCSVSFLLRWYEVMWVELIANIVGGRLVVRLLRGLLLCRFNGAVEGRNLCLLRDPAGLIV